MNKPKNTIDNVRLQVEESTRIKTMISIQLEEKEKICVDQEKEVKKVIAYLTNQL